ncbi:C40 family peptidase [Blastococcus saxobsidens]|uniref:Cell wall-associated hydrolase, invasion-associated protein n=1 Tax=Blastococcus saxobsidens (strain DD2) TaxID=1146883 RepID=H6RQ94_BLASD|nr:C40 family peptidase [Blastococcus saxobsidens]CCG04061.1 Cell wall-associated hydrolase, invasion-associated protein [Blastococcus saxobsidens DD2]
MPRWALRGAGTGIAALILLGLAPGVAVAAPSAADVAAAEVARDAAAEEVGRLAAELAAAEAAAARAGQDSQIALQDYEETQVALEVARATVLAAQAAVAAAQAELHHGRAEVVSFARTSYMQGTTSPGITAPMSSGGPAELIQRATLLEAAGTHRVDVVGRLTVLEQQATTAEQQASTAAEEAVRLEVRAAEQLAVAQAREIAAREQTAAVAEQQAAVERQFAAAEAEVGELVAARTAATPAPRPTVSTPPAGSGTPGTPPAGPGTRTTPAPRGPTTTTPGSGSSADGGSGGASGGGGTPAPAPAPTTVGAPSASAVQTAIDAAMSQQGLPYSWGGGGSAGPGYGIPPDTATWGFDCSGLTQYAYARAGIQIGGTSREQYSRFSDRTVARADLRPGDLVFWGSGSSYQSIYHVALYLGDNTVVHAPESGDVVKVASMRFGSDYFGAVRPSA